MSDQSQEASMPRFEIAKLFQEAEPRNNDLKNSSKDGRFATDLLLLHFFFLSSEHEKCSDDVL